MKVWVVHKDGYIYGVFRNELDAEMAKRVAEKDRDLAGHTFLNAMVNKTKKVLV